MQITYKGKIHNITCDNRMPMYVHDDSSEECSHTIRMCKKCILMHLGAEINEGWDDEENISYNMQLSIGNTKFDL